MAANSYSNILTDKTSYKQLSNKLKTKINEIQGASFRDFVTNLIRYDYSI